jgi:hypothetical protein
MTEETQNRTRKEITDAAKLVIDELSDENGELHCEITEDQADYKLKLTDKERGYLSDALSLSLARLNAEGDGDTEMANSILAVKNRLTYTELEET